MNRVADKNVACFVRGLLRCMACEGNHHSTAPRALHTSPQNRCRGYEDLFRASQDLIVVQKTKIKTY